MMKSSLSGCVLPRKVVPHLCTSADGPGALSCTTSPIRARSGGSGQGQRDSKLLARRDGNELEISGDVPCNACFGGQIGEPRGALASSKSVEVTVLDLTSCAPVWRTNVRRPASARNWTLPASFATKMSSPKDSGTFRVVRTGPVPWIVAHRARDAVAPCRPLQGPWAVRRFRPRSYESGSDLPSDAASVLMAKPCGSCCTPSSRNVQMRKKTQPEHTNCFSAAGRGVAVATARPRRRLPARRRLAIDRLSRIHG